MSRRGPANRQPGMTTPDRTSPSTGEMLEQILDLALGSVTVLLPSLLLAVPGLVLTALLLAPIVIPLLALGVLLAPPVLLWRLLRR